MFKAIKKYIEKKKQPKTNEQIIKEVISYSLAIVIMAILAFFFKPTSASATDIWNYGLDKKDDPYTYQRYDADNNKIGDPYEIDEYDVELPDESDGALAGLIGDFITDAIVQGFLARLVPIANTIIEFVVKLISSAFEPSLTPLVTIENGLNLTQEKLNDTVLGGTILESVDSDGHITLGDSYIMGSIWKFSMYFGVATATIIALFNLLLCVFGRSQDIKDTPAGIGFKYGIAVLLIAISRAFMTSFINLYGDIWSEFIFNADTLSAMNGSGAGACFFPAQLIQKGERMIIFGQFSIVTDTLLATGPGSILVLVLLVIAIVFAFKLLSEMVKLFLEIVERYFVFFILIAFFPALAATITTNNSKKIFYAYIKMVYTQGFLLIINTVFMSIFVFVLCRGGWTAGLLNFLAALAFLRICQRIDAYMAQMGFNVVQTGSGLAGAIGGAGMGFLSAMKGMQTLNKGRQNIGSGLKNLGLRTNNTGLAKAGSVIGASGKQLIGGELSNEGLSQSIMKGQAGFAAQAQGGNGAGRFGTLDSSGGWDSVKQSMADFGMSDMQADRTVADLKANGYKPEDCNGIYQNDDSSENFKITKGNDETGGDAFATSTINGTQVLDSAEYAAASKELANMSTADPSQRANLSGATTTEAIPSGLNEAISDYFNSNGVISQVNKDSFNNSSGDTTALSTSSAKMDVNRPVGVAGEYNANVIQGNTTYTAKVYSLANNSELRNNPNYDIFMCNQNEYAIEKKGSINKNGVKNTKAKPGQRKNKNR